MGPMSLRSLSRYALVLLAVFSAGQVFAQRDPDEEEIPGSAQTRNMAKEEEQRKFHPTKVIGTDAQTRIRAFEQRERMKKESPFGGLLWRNIGPEISSGRIIDIAAPAQKPDDLYVAFATGGLYRTTDEGITWTNVFDSAGIPGIGAIALSKDGQTIWVGTGEANSQRTSYSGMGVFKSTDAGKTWVRMGLEATHHTGKIIIDPRNENTVYVATMGGLYSQNPERGLYKTTDGGKTWANVLKVDDYTGVVDIAMDPRNSNVLYASAWDRDRRAWNFRESGKGSAVYKTVDAGKTWKKIEGLPTGFAAGRVGLALCPSKPDTIYAFVDNQSEDVDWLYEDDRTPSGQLTPRRFLLLTDELFLAMDKKVLETFFRRYQAGDLTVDQALEQVKGKKLTMEQLREKVIAKNPAAFDKGLGGAELYRSDDAGKTWYMPARGRIGDFGGYYWGKVFVNPKDVNDIYVLGAPMLRSLDGGKSWAESADRAHSDFHVVYHDPRYTTKTWIGTDGGLYVSNDGGDSIRAVHNLSVSQATTVAVDNASPYNVYVGLQDNGAKMGPSNYRPGISDPSLWKTIGGGDGGMITIDPRENGIMYVGVYFGTHGGTNTKTNERWSVRANPPRGDDAARYNWVTPLVVDPFLPDMIYIGAQRLYRSFNNGHSYEPISPDLTKSLPNGDVPYSTIKDISASPLQFGLIYVGCDDGNVQVTRDGGFNWTKINTPADSKWVTRVVASKWDKGTVYVSQNGYREDDWSSILWKSTDFGKTWTSIVGNLPAEPINVIREDPNHKGMLYVGTDMGVYVSFDDGKKWETLSGIPNLPVHDIAVQAREGDLVIGTHARGAYILPLRLVYDLTPEIREKDLTLWEPSAVRINANLPYSNRAIYETADPRSPVLRLQFYTKTPGKATIRIKDKDGKVVKESTVDALTGYNFFDTDLKLTAGKPDTTDVRHRPIKTVEDVLRDPRESERPTYVKPGDYTVEVEVNGKVASQKWTVNG